MPDWWSATQLANHYAVSRRSMYRAIATGEIVHHVLAGCIRVSDQERLAWERRGFVGAAPMKPKPKRLSKPAIDKLAMRLGL